MTGLTVTKISAENILKFDQFSLDNLTKLTLYRGANNQGKTTALKLLSLCVKGTDNPKSVIHDGASKASVSLELSNGFTLRRSFTEKGQYFKLIDERGHEVPKPQEQIDRILGEYRDFNPLAWLAMPAKEQVRILLQAIDVRLTEEGFTAATALEPPIGVDFDRHGLLVIDTLRDYYADERKTQNKIADQKKKAAAEAREQLPPAKPVITDARREEAARTLSEARQKKGSVEARQLAAKEHAAAVERLGRDVQRERDEQSRIAKDVATLEAEIEEIKRRIVRKHEQQAESVRRQAEIESELATLATSAPPTPAEVEDVNLAIRRANELSVAIQSDEKVLARFEDVERMESDAANAAAQASILDQTVKVVSGELRQQLLAKAALPVGSLAIDGDRILVDGHELQHVAESQQIRVALAIARALRPALRVIVLDGAERLDANTFAIFLEEIRGDGFTYFATEVDRDGGALEIIRFSETATAIVEQQEVA
jgi:hypothetical protein